MAMSIHRSWSAIILFTVLMTDCLCLAAPPPQLVPEEDTAAQEERPRGRQPQRNQRNPILPVPEPEDPQGQPVPEPEDPQGQPEPSPPESSMPKSSTPDSSRQAQSSLQPSNGKMQLNFIDAPLTEFIRQISELLNLTPLVIDPDVQGSVTIHSSEPMSKEEVLALLHLILKTKSVSLIEQNGIYQVVPVESALRTGVDLIEHPAPDVDAPPRAGGPESSEIPEISTNVIPVEFIPVQDLVKPIELFITPGGAIGTYDRLNMLILTDYSDNVERVINIIRLLDSRYMDPELVELIKIEHNASADVVADLQKMFGSGEQNSSTGISFVSLDRMNAIFVVASSNRGLEEVRRWIEILDATTGRNIQNNVYIVKNSTASNIATLLSALYGGEGTTQPSLGTESQSSGRTGGAQGGSMLDGGSILGGSTGQQRGSFGSFSNAGSMQSGGYQSGGMFGGGYFTGGQQLNPQFGASRGISSVIIQGGEFSGLQDTIRLVVDDINNRLFIQSTAADYAFILEAIVSMDVMPRQVRIDASIYEVDLTDDLSLGVGVALRERTGGSSTTVALNPPVEGLPQGISVVNVALIGNSQELISAMNALREKTNVKILENPTVFAMDGREAYITVGSEVPYPGTSYTQAVGGTTTSVQYRDTGVTLFVRPKISESGSITMDVLQEVSAVGPTTSLGPTFNKSRVETTLIVKDGETVAIAGLIRDTNSWTRVGFPLISDIPVLGSLFGQTVRSTRRSELVILLSPHVIGDSNKFNTMTREFKDSMRNLRKFADDQDRQKVENRQKAEEDRRKEEEKRLLEEQKQRRKESEK